MLNHEYFGSIVVHNLYIECVSSMRFCGEKIKPLSLGYSSIWDKSITVHSNIQGGAGKWMDGRGRWVQKYLNAIKIVFELQMHFAEVAFFSDWNSRRIFEVVYLVQLIKHPNLRIPNFNLPNLRCCKVFFFLFDITSYIGIFGCTLISN